MLIKTLLASISIMVALVSCKPPMRSKPNVLFIAVDDLRPDLGFSHHPVVKSPNIDRLAQEGVVFNHHYVTVPTCGASRASLLTGLLPSTTGHLSNHVFENIISKQVQKEQPESFVHHLRQNGYYTVGIGKISHSADGLIYAYEEPVGNELELPYSWDEMLLDYGSWETGWNAFFAYAGGKNRTHENKKVKPYEAADVPDEGYPDGLIAKLAVEKIQALAEGQQPFFLGVGFFKPHLPFNAPKKYWDLYSPDSIPLSPNPFLPEAVNRNSLHGSGEFNQYADGAEKASLDTTLSDEYARKLVQGYFACISYIDAQIGKVLEELHKQGLAENTLVILWSDHGWHLGDHRVWGKHTLFQRSLRSPLIIKLPGANSPVTSNHIVSSVDIYPTLVELCGLPIPKEVDGKSLVPILKNHPSRWVDRAFSYFKNGISLKTNRYRITQYFREDLPAIELYDHQVDPLETKNVAAEQPELVKALLDSLSVGNTGLYEPGNN